MSSKSAVEIDNLLKAVQSVLDEALSLGPRAYTLQPSNRLLGSVPELDSQAVVSVIVGLEERFDIVIGDDDIDAAAFETVGSLMSLVSRRLQAG